MKLASIGFLFAALSSVASALSPSGSYAGSKTVAGQTVQCLVNVIDSSTMDLSIAGIISLACPSESYHMTGDSIFVDGLSTDGNCVHDALADNKVTLKTIVFDEASDKITVSVKYSVMNLDIILSKNGEIDFVETTTSLALATVPTGHYTGSKTVFGQAVNGSVNFQSSTLLDFGITGIVTIDCAGEAYTLSGSTIVITNILTPGDCAHDALSDNSATLSSLTYNSSTDQITVVVKVSIATVTIVLSKTGDFANDMPIQSMLLLGATPAGTYAGSKVVFGVSVNGVVKIQSDKLMEFIISGVIDIDCADEAYTLAADGSVTLDNVLKAGDCAHDALEKNKVDLNSIVYDAAANTITVKVKYSVATVTIVMTHQAEAVTTFLRGSSNAQAIA